MNYNEVREGLQKWAVESTAGCDLQDGWPCGTCMCELLANLGVKENGERNNPVDRVNEMWRGILQIREADLDN